MPETPGGGGVESPSLSGNWGSVLVLNNAEAGRGYSAELYSGGSAAGERLGYGWARASGAAGTGNGTGNVSASIVLFAEAGGVSVPAGNYFVVITETDFERHVVVKHTIGSIGGNTSLDWKTGLQETPAPAPSAVNTGIITIKNKDLTKTYSADVYPSTGKSGMLKDEVYRVYTAESQRVAAGERQSSVIYLKRNGGEAFTGQGIFLVVLTEFNTDTWKASSRYLGAATFGANGNAVLDWPAMWRVEPPVDMPRPDKGILTLKNADSAEYTAEVYVNPRSWTFTDYATYKEWIAEEPLAEGKRQKPEPPKPYEVYLAKDHKEFDQRGPFMVRLTSEEGLVYYKTGVIFDQNGCATVYLDATEDAPKPNPPDPRSVVPDSPEAGKLTVTPNTDYGPMADQVYYTKEAAPAHNPNDFADNELNPEHGHGVIEPLPDGGLTATGLDYGKDYYIWIRRIEDGIYSEWVLVAPHNIGEGDIAEDETAVNPVTIASPLSPTALRFASNVLGTLTAEKAEPTDTKTYEVFYALEEDGVTVDPNTASGAVVPTVNGHTKSGTFSLATDSTEASENGLWGGKKYAVWFRTTDGGEPTSDWLQAAEDTAEPANTTGIRLVKGRTFGQTTDTNSVLAYMDAEKGYHTTEADTLIIDDLHPGMEELAATTTTPAVSLTAYNANAPAYVEIDGNGRTVQLTGQGYLLDLAANSGVTLTLKNITLKGHDNNTKGLVRTRHGSHLILEDGAEITENKSVDGGGVYLWGGSLTMRGTSIISDNTATNKGGGVILIPYDNSVTSVFTMEGGIISGNKSTAMPTTSTTGGGGIYIYNHPAIFTMKIVDGRPPPQIINNKNADHSSTRGGGVYRSTNNASLEVNLWGGTIAANDSPQTWNHLVGEIDPPPAGSPMYIADTLP